MLIILFVSFVILLLIGAPIAYSVSECASAIFIKSFLSGRYSLRSPRIFNAFPRKSFLRPRNTIKSQMFSTHLHIFYLQTCASVL